MPPLLSHHCSLPVGACRQCLVRWRCRRPLAEADPGRPDAVSHGLVRYAVAEAMKMKTQARPSPGRRQGAEEDDRVPPGSTTRWTTTSTRARTCRSRRSSNSHGSPTSTQAVALKHTFPKPMTFSAQVLLDHERSICSARRSTGSSSHGSPFITLVTSYPAADPHLREEAVQFLLGQTPIQICITATAWPTASARAFDLMSSPRSPSADACRSRPSCRPPPRLRVIRA